MTDQLLNRTNNNQRGKRTYGEMLTHVMVHTVITANKDDRSVSSYSTNMKPQYQDTSDVILEPQQRSGGATETHVTCQSFCPPFIYCSIRYKLKSSIICTFTFLKSVPPANVEGEGPVHLHCSQPLGALTFLFFSFRRVTLGETLKNPVTDLYINFPTLSNQAVGMFQTKFFNIDKSEPILADTRSGHCLHTEPEKVCGCIVSSFIRI